jgi:hypothetical protein
MILAKSEGKRDGGPSVKGYLAFEYRVQNSRKTHQNWALDAIGLFCCRILVQNKLMIFGYARVSTDGQSVNAQVAVLRSTAQAKCSAKWRAEPRQTGRSFAA